MWSAVCYSDCQNGLRTSLGMEEPVRRVSGEDHICCIDAYGLLLTPVSIASWKGLRAFSSTPVTEKRIFCAPDSTWQEPQPWAQ